METRETTNGIPPQVWGPPPPVAPRASIPWLVISIVTGFVVLAALLAMTVFVWQGAKGDLATSQDHLAEMTDDYEASQERVAALETDISDLEGRVNGANITLASARTCIEGLQDATSAVRGFYGSEDWYTFYERLRDVRGLCRRVMNSTAGVI